MKKPDDPKNSILFCIVVMLFFGSCKSAIVPLVEKTGRALDGSAAENKRVAVYRAAKKDGAAADIELWEIQDKEKNRGIVILLDQFPSIRLRGSLPNDTGEFYFTSLEYLAGSFHGWNEYRLDLLGTGSLKVFDNSAVLAVPGKIEKVQISAGRIQRYDSRITGNDAAARLRDRHERITALTGWMKQTDNAPKKLNRNEFEEYWKPLLFPELTRKKRQPKDWNHEGDQWVRSEDIRWNIGYTNRTFPEELRQIRNTGTMLRDWEEALPWIYIEYEWENIAELLSHEINLQKKKN